MQLNNIEEKFENMEDNAENIQNSFRENREIRDSLMSKNNINDSIEGGENLLCDILGSSMLSNGSSCMVLNSASNPSNHIEITPSIESIN